MRYEPALDGLRALAVSVIVFFHFYGSAIIGGWIAVDIFFVLSGYLISTLLRTEQRDTGTVDLRKFYWFRFLRLAPALFVLLAFIGLLALFSQDHRAGHLHSMLVAALYYMNWHEAFQMGSPGLLGHTWSLSLEEQFYFVWPLIILATGRNKHFTALTVFFILSIAAWRIYLNQQGAPWYRTYFAGDTHSESLLAGCLLANIINSSAVKKASHYWPLPAMTLAAIAFTLKPVSDAAQTWGITIVSIMSAWMIACILHDPTPRKFFSAKFLVYTGRISYGWYLWHVPVLLLFKYKANDSDPWTLLIYPAMGAASYLAAALSFRFVETPVLRLKKRYKKRVSAKPQPSALE